MIIIQPNVFKQFSDHHQPLNFTVTQSTDVEFDDHSDNEMKWHIKAVYQLKTSWYGGMLQCLIEG
jgi:hypothetical protein